MNLQIAKDKLTNKFANLTDLKSGIVHGTRKNGDKDVAAYFFDFNRRLPNTVGELHSYLDDVIGGVFFDKGTSPDLRWNSYLYFVVDKSNSESEGFAIAKRNLEADKSYARKYVVFEDDLDQVLAEIDSIAEGDKGSIATDIFEVWSEKLEVLGLEDVMKPDRPITDIVRKLANKPAKNTRRSSKETGLADSRILLSDFVSNLDLTKFRPHLSKLKFTGFKRANLIFGQNGAGKTSLMEGIEYLYCGENRRSNAPHGISVSATLSSGKEVITASSTKLTDFKTRQRLWYGINDKSPVNTLPNQFGRFNFLNTDAAAELSLLDDASSRSIDSLSELVSGHETSAIWQRITSVHRALKEEIEKRRTEIAIATHDKEKNDAQLKILRDLPGQADAAFSIFIQGLENLKWIALPIRKDEVDNLLVDELTRLAASIEVIPQLNWLPIVASQESIESLFQTYTTTSAELKNLLAQMNEVRTKQEGLKGTLDNSRESKAKLEALPFDAVFEIQTLTQTLLQTRKFSSDNAAALASISQISLPPTFRDEWGDKQLLAALTSCNEQTNKLSKELAEVEQRMHAASASFTEYQNIRSNLIDWSLKSLKHTPSNNCPVCETAFAPGQLIKLLTQTASRSGPLLAEFRLHITSLRERLTALNESTTYLASLIDYATRRVISLDTDVWIVIADAFDLLKQHEDYLELQQRCEEKLNSYGQLGLSLQTIQNLCTPVIAGAPIKNDSLDVAFAIHALDDWIQSIEHQLENTNQATLSLNQSIDKQLSIVKQEHLSAQDAVDLLRIRSSKLERAVNACSKLSQSLFLTTDADLSEVASLLSSSILSAQTVIAANEHDRNSAVNANKLEEKITTLSDRLTTLKETVKYLQNLHVSLDDIVKNHSLEAATTSVVSAAHKVQSKIFQRIHSPCEYSVTDNAQSPLSRISNASPVGLHQISTGQRAAYALSVFLSLNTQLEHGPKVLLLDDPISHIDDLNSLSFLDYLRNLVLKSDRQLFFATADDKLAGLFAHKFGFLGDEFTITELAKS